MFTSNYIYVDKEEILSLPLQFSGLDRTLKKQTFLLVGPKYASACSFAGRMQATWTSRLSPFYFMEVKSFRLILKMTMLDNSWKFFIFQL